MRGERTHAWGSRGGFCLAELLLASLLAGLLGALLLGALLFFEQALLPRRVGFGGEVLAQAPCFEQVPRAMALHAVLRRELAACTAAYVFGGDGGGASSDWVGTQPLELHELPEFGAQVKGLSPDSGAFGVAARAVLGAAESRFTASDFTLLLVACSESSLPTARCLVQCRTSEVRLAGSSEVWLRRETRLWAAGGLELSYAFLESGAGGLYCGALHSWQKLAPDGRSGREGPATLVFPDPWVFAGGRGTSPGLPAGSRFTYFIPVHP